MKDFVVYTAARVGLYAVSYVAVWAVASLIWTMPPLWNFADLRNLMALMVALVIGSVIAQFALGALRDRLAGAMQQRAHAINEKIEESRRAEDAD